MVVASPRIEAYLNDINDRVNHAFKIAVQARSQGLDPSDQVDVRLAKNLAERVVGLISVVAPQIAKSGVVDRIIELEKQYGTLDWRVAMVIALEIAQKKFVQFPDDIEAINTGIRVGFAYVTVGVVSSPLEGFTTIEVKRRRDGGSYWAMNFAGPIRNAGGTAAAVAVLIADYVRKHLGVAKYDPDEKECERTYTEVMDYHEKVTNLQYTPSKDELMFLVRNNPIEVAGDPSEKVEVSNFKDMPRIKTNRIRSGMCLINSSCIPLKAPKLWKNLSKWIDAMGMEDWKFLEEFLNLQKKAKSKGATTTSHSPIYPIYTYMEDLVGGRPVIGHPLRPGGLRLRYGRSRVSGFSAQSLHPATMGVLDDFVAIATQFKVERPGKAAAFTSCDSLEGPIVLLDDGSVQQIHTFVEAKRITDRVVRILYLGDILVCYGDFFDRNHTLMPSGYCEEWWVQELEKAVIAKFGSLDFTQLSASIPNTTIEFFTTLFSIPIKTPISVAVAFALSSTYGIPLHPKFTPFWKLASNEQILSLFTGLERAFKNADGDVLVPVAIKDDPFKIALERLGIVHKKVTEHVLLDPAWVQVFEMQFGITSKESASDILRKAVVALPTAADGLSLINAISSVVVRDKAGIFIGARMGRPEKAKMRKIPGQPYGVAPQERDLPDKTTKIVTEHDAKAIIRQKYDIHVNKDGTVRYDGSEVPITHFKPKEVDVTPTRLVELGYALDIHGKPLLRDDQIVELLAQDLIIPCCPSSPNEPGDEIMIRVANFIDELLIKHYKLEPFYNVKTRSDLVGQLIFGLAPHTSAATAGRIIGFTKSQGIFCHPMFHAAMRRDCDGDETCFFLLMDGLLNFSTDFLPQHRGGTMDAPLVLTSIINPSEVDDMFFNIDIVWKYPLEFYEAASLCKKPYDVKLALAGSTLNKPAQFEGMGFTHDTDDFNDGVLCSSYKTLPSMQEKVNGAMRLAEKIDAVDATDVAEIVIKKHFLRDIAGNMRKFSQQEFRCIKCNAKYRRPPVSGKCNKCPAGKIVFTVSQASVVKYLEMSITLAKKYNVSPYTRQVLDILRVRADGMFGKETEKQTGLSAFFA